MSTMTIEHGRQVWRNDKKQVHREDGPAIVYPNGDTAWYQNGIPHREIGPAVELAYGTKEWWVNGKRHNPDGAAIHFADGTQEFWINDFRIHKQVIDAIKSFSPEGIQALLNA